MQVAILSDTHLPEPADELPDAFRERIADADHVIHAGDTASEQALADLRSLTGDLTAVYGNADPDDIDLPKVAALDVADVTFVVTHGMINHVRAAVYPSSAGLVLSRDDWLDAVTDTARARAGGEETVIAVGGHIHEVVDEIHDGIRALNPGTACGVGVDSATMMTASVDDGDVDVTVHEA